MRFRRSRVLLIATLAAIVSTSTLASPAEGFPHDDNWSCDEPGGGLFFADEGPSGHDWSAAEKQLVLGAAQEWNLLDNRNGDKYTAFTEVSTLGATDVEVRKRDITPNGQAGCASGDLFLNLQRTMVENDTAKTEVVTKHEIGHLLELDHTGRYDNYDGITTPQDPPIMSTCANSSWTTTREISNDDTGQLTDRKDSTTTLKRLTANPSFEDALDYWEKLSVGGAAVHTGISSSGNYIGDFHLRFRHDTGGSRVQNVTRVAEGSGHTFDAQGRFQRTSSAHTGKVTLTIVYRNVDYDNTPNNCTYVGSYDMNDVTPAGWWGVVGTKTQAITTGSWYTVSINSVVASTAHDAIDLGILLYSSMNNCNNESNNSCRVDVKADDVYVWLWH